MDTSFLSATILLVLITDPLGNIPFFIAALRKVRPERRRIVVVRECLIAFAGFSRERPSRIASGVSEEIQSPPSPPLFEWTFVTVTFVRLRLVALRRRSVRRRRP